MRLIQIKVSLSLDSIESEIEFKVHDIVYNCKVLILYMLSHACMTVSSYILLGSKCINIADNLGPLEHGSHLVIKLWEWTGACG